MSYDMSNAPTLNGYEKAVKRLKDASELRAEKQTFFEK